MKSSPSSATKSQRSQKKKLNKMNIQKHLESSAERFRERFGRKNIETNTYPPKWFVRDDVMQGEVEQFLLTEQKAIMEKVAQYIENELQGIKSMGELTSEGEKTYSVVEEIMNDLLSHIRLQKQNPQKVEEWIADNFIVLKNGTLVERKSIKVGVIFGQDTTINSLNKIVEYVKTETHNHAIEKESENQVEEEK